VPEPATAPPAVARPAPDPLAPLRERYRERATTFEAQRDALSDREQTEARRELSRLRRQIVAQSPDAGPLPSLPTGAQLRKLDPRRAREEADKLVALYEARAADYRSDRPGLSETARFDRQIELTELSERIDALERLRTKSAPPRSRGAGRKRPKKRR